MKLREAWLSNPIEQMQSTQDDPAEEAIDLTMEVLDDTTETRKELRLPRVVISPRPSFNKDDDDDFVSSL